MQYKYIGKKQFKVSRIALGTWQFGRQGGWGDFDIKEGEKIIECCLQNGVTLIDTAEVYGESEEILGKLLKGKREKFIIATKLTTRAEGNRFDYDTIKPHIEKSLKRLQTDYIDLYQIHWPKMKHLWYREDMQKKDYEDILNSITKLQKEGLIRLAGVSNFRVHHLKELALNRPMSHRTGSGFTTEALNLITSNQIPYSVLWRCYDIDQTAEFCKKNNISLLAYSPLAEGLLTGRFTLNRPTPRRTGSGFDNNTNTEIKERVRRVNVLFNEPIYSKALGVVEEIKKIADEIGATPAQVALKWTMEKGNIASVLVGSRKATHFEENIEAVDIDLTEEQKDYIDKLSLEFQKKYLLPRLESWLFNCISEDLDKIGLKKPF